MRKQSDLQSSIEEADCGIIQHIVRAGLEQNERIVLLSEDTDVVIYNLAYFAIFKERGIKQVWIKFGTQQKKRDVPLHRLAEHLGDEKCLALLKAHILTGCNVTSEVGDKGNCLKIKSRDFLETLWRRTISRFEFVTCREVS